MGNYQSKDIVISAQAQVASAEKLQSHIQIFGIVVIILIIMASIGLLYAIRRGCANRVRKWIRKEAAKVVVTEIKTVPRTTTNVTTARPGAV